MLIKPDRPSLPPLPTSAAPRINSPLDAAIERLHKLRLLKALERVEAELRAKGAIE